MSRFQTFSKSFKCFVLRFYTPVNCITKLELWILLGCSSVATCGHVAVSCFMYGFQKYIVKFVFKQCVPTKYNK